MYITIHNLKHNPLPNLTITFCVLNFVYFVFQTICILCLRNISFCVWNILYFVFETIIFLCLKHFVFCVWEKCSWLSDQPPTFNFLTVLLGDTLTLMSGTKFGNIFPKIYFNCTKLLKYISQSIFQMYNTLQISISKYISIGLHSSNIFLQIDFHSLTLFYRYLSEKYISIVQNYSNILQLLLFKLVKIIISKIYIQMYDNNIQFFSRHKIQTTTFSRLKICIVCTSDIENSCQLYWKLKCMRHWNIERLNTHNILKFGTYFILINWRRKNVNNVLFCIVQTAHLNLNQFYHFSCWNWR